MSKKLNGTWILPTLALAIALSACGKNGGGESPMTDAPVADDPHTQDINAAIQETANLAPQAEAPSANAAPALASSYLGESVMLIHPHPANFGMISVKGEDAKILFHALAVKDTRGGGNLVWNASKIRRGHAYSCYEQSRKETPKALEYSCSLHIDYKAGSVLTQLREIRRDDKIRRLKRSYNGESVMLAAPDHPAFFGVIQVKGEDARMLYSTLDAPERETTGNELWLDGKERVSKNVACYTMSKKDAPETKSYACSVYVNHRTGAVFPAKVD